MSDALPCGHHRHNLIDIDDQPVCYVCWAIDSGNYTFEHGYPTGPEFAHAEVTALAAKVRQLAAMVANQERILHRLLNSEDHERRDRTVVVVDDDSGDVAGIDPDQL